MQHPLLTGGSAFRSKLPKDPTTKDIEFAMVNSGLLGKTPSQHKIKYSKPSLADIKPPQDQNVCPLNQNNLPQRPRTAITTNRNRNNNFNYLNQNKTNANKNNTPRTTRTPRATKKSAAQRPQTPISSTSTARSRISEYTTSRSRISEPATVRSRIAASNSEKIILKPESNKKKNSENNSGVFYGRVLNSSDPPSSVNFIQLNEILTRLLHQQEIRNKYFERVENIRKKREEKEKKKEIENKVSFDQTESEQNNKKHELEQNSEKNELEQNNEKHELEQNNEKHELEQNNEKHESEQNNEKHELEQNNEKHESEKNESEFIEEEEEIYDSKDEDENEEEEEEIPEDFFSNTENVDIKSIYYNIFGEVIRQYFVECSAQGDLLSDCREYFSMANVKIPQIKKHYDDIINSIENQVKEDKEAIRSLGPEIESNEKHRIHLQKLIEEFRTDLKILTDHHDVLMNQLAVAFRELSEIQQTVNQINSRLDRKTRKLVELIEELRSLDSISASYTSDTIRFADNLRQIRVQQESGLKQIEANQNEVNRLKSTIQLIDKDIVRFTEDIENSRIKPVVSFMGVQVDLVSRRLFKEPKTIETVMKETASDRVQFNGNLFEKVRKEYISKNKKLTNFNDGIVIDSYEDFAKFKQIILKYEQEMHMSNEVIESAEQGEFSYDGKNTEKSIDFIKIFASNLSKTIVNDAIQNVSFKRVSTQTLIEQEEFQLEEEATPINKETSPLLSLIEADYSQRAPQQLDWITQTIREIYNAKTIEDEKILNKKSITELRSLSQFIYSYFHKKHKIQFFADQVCWDVYLSSHEHQERTQEVDIFIGFLDETLNTEQLAFFLLMRSDCLKIGASVTMFTRDSIDKYNEYFLSDSQIESLMKSWWFDKYKKEYFNSVMELSIPRPAIYLESTKRYVAMNDILIKNIMFYQEDAIERLNDLLLKYRIKPRLTLSQFNNLIDIIIPSLKKEQIADFYRATVTKANERINTSVDEFVVAFNNTSVIMDRFRNRAKIDGSFGNNPVMLGAVSDIWGNCQNSLEKIFNFFQSQASLQPDNLTLKILFDDASRYWNNLVHSIAIDDGEMAIINYYQLMFALDVLFSTLNLELTPDSLISMECAIRESWLEKAYH